MKNQYQNQVENNLIIKSDNYLRLSLIKNSMIIRLFLITFIISANSSAQTVTNGNFTSGSAGWGCSPETNPESVYGGSGANIVAEVDQAAWLCQTISGFTIGSLYQITFVCSRRTTCGPAVQSMDFYIDNGALSTQSISRTGTFAFTPETFTFTATSTSQMIHFQGTSAGTCGIIIDNIVITLISPLSIELVNFTAFPVNNKYVQLDWQTTSEKNNDYFTIERTMDGKSWQEINKVAGAGNSSSLLNYSERDNQPYSGVSYYRIKQTDYDGKFSYSQVRNVTIERLNNIQIELYPNPASNKITIEGDETELKNIRIFAILGKEVTELTVQQKISETKLIIDLSQLIKGTYYIKTKSTVNKFLKQ